MTNLQKELEAARAACWALEEQARRAQKLEEKLQRFCYEEKAKKRARAKRAEELFNKYVELDQSSSTPLSAYGSSEDNGSLTFRSTTRSSRNSSTEP